MKVRKYFELIKLWLIKNFKLELFIALLALVVSGYTLWDNSIKVSIDVSAGRQVDLYVGSI
jgi:hypothetical protein